MIEHADCAQRVAVAGDDRRAGVKADMRFAQDQRILTEPVIEQRVLDNEDFVRRMIA